MYKMTPPKLILFALLLWNVVPLFPKGGAEKAGEETIHNNEWVLCVTEFDVSALPASRQVFGGVLLRALLQSLQGVEHRVREDDEIQYYRDYAWSKSQSEAAKALAAKQNDRDLLVYRGEPEWRYTKTLKTYEEEILKLEEEIRLQKEKIPSVEPRPLLVIKDETGRRPAAPPEGEEYHFCVAQKADAFLSGTVSEFHGRIYLTLRLYTLYSRSFSWEDTILFSSQDMNAALPELSGRFMAAVSGTKAANIAIHARPEGAMVLIDNSLAGLGEVPLREHIPGSLEIAAHAENHEALSFPLDIEAGETAEVFIDLRPLELLDFTVDAPESPDSSVYLGSMYLGRTPLKIELPRDQYSYISVETPSGETGSAVAQGEVPVRGTAEFVTVDNSMIFKTGIPVSPEEKRVETARRNFYSAFGRFWIALPVSIFAMGLADNFINANDYRSSESVRAKAQAGSLVKYGAYGLIGLSAADVVYRVYRYLNASGTEADPIARFAPPETEPVE